MSARTGPSHPLCLAAVATLVVNDHWLKSVWPGVVSGKLSDLAWLVVAPIVVAAVLSTLGAGDRLARTLSLGATGVSFVALQLWPPLGDTWVGAFGGSHVADAANLLTLPALLLAPLCWRPVRRRVLALPVAAFACLATSYSLCDQARFPSDGVAAWDPHEPLSLSAGHAVARHDTVGVARSISLRPEGSDREVEVALGSVGNLVLVCPLGGLEPGPIVPLEG